MATSRLSTRRVDWRVQVGTSNKPGQGLVIFEASVSYIPDPLAAGGPRTAIPEPVAAVLDSGGYACTPATGDPSAPGERGVPLFTTDSLGEDGGDWTWTARPQLRSVNGVQMANAVPAFSFAVPAGAGSLDLAEVQKVPASPGLGTERALALVLRAEKAAQTALNAVGEAVDEAAETAVGMALDSAEVFRGAVESPDNTLALAFTDKYGRRFWIEAGLDGRPTAHTKKILTEDLTPGLVETVGPELGIIDLDELYGWAWSVTDKHDRVMGGFKLDGTFVAFKQEHRDSSIPFDALDPEVRKILAAGSVRPASLPVADGVLASRPAGGTWQLRHENTATGASRLLYSAGAIQELSLSSDGAHVFFTAADADGSNTRTMYVPASGGTAARVIPYTGLAAFGDSMTEGMGGGYGANAYPAVAAAELGIPFYNGGISSQLSTEIAIRQGGISPAFNVPGNTIPASGSVGLAIVEPTGMFRNDFAWSWKGSLAGITGTLAKAKDTNTWSFTRDHTGTAKTVAPGVKFISTPGTDYDDWIQTIWSGRNNPTLSTVIRDTAAMVAYLKPWQKRYLVFSICNNASEPIGSAGYNNVASINTRLSEVYGTRFLDVRSWLIANGLSMAGITPTTQDVDDIANDIIPVSLRADSTHLNKMGYDVLGKYVASVITAKGWV